jgi:hypothetical protein
MKLDLTHPQHRQGDDYERRVGERLQQALPGVCIYFSNEVLPKLREFERNSTGVSVQRQTRRRRERWIRTSGSWSRDRQTVIGEVTAFSKPGADLLGNGRFESISLQRLVRSELRIE